MQLSRDGTVEILLIHTGLDQPRSHRHAPQGVSASSRLTETLIKRNSKTNPRESRIAWHLSTKPASISEVLITMIKSRTGRARYIEHIERLL